MNKDIKYITLIGCHAVLGYLIYLNETLAKVYFIGVLAYFLFRIVTSQENDKVFEILKGCAYLVGAEVFLRTTKGLFFYEAIKYLIVLFSLVGILYKGISGRAYPYFLYILLLIPSIFVASTTLSFDANFRTNITFVLSGPICLGVLALFLFEKRVTRSQLTTVLQSALLPLIAHTTYIYFYTPDLKEVLTNTASNFAAAGGFGANQVVTALGLGIIILGIKLFDSRASNTTKILNLVLIIFIGYRAVSTLSRGGVITAVLTLAVFLFFYARAVPVKHQGKLMFTFFLLAFGFIMAWTISTYETGGVTELRYSNRDFQGREKADISTGRFDLIQKEFEGFLDSPFLGIGSSRAKDRRIEIEGQGVTSHNELSRTLAEHGILGIIILLILIFKPFDILLKSKTYNYHYFFAFLAFWFLTINHSSMRIAMPAFIYALALIYVTNDKKRSVRRQLPQRA